MNPSGDPALGFLWICLAVGGVLALGGLGWLVYCIVGLLRIGSKGWDR